MEFVHLEGVPQPDPYGASKPWANSPLNRDPLVARSAKQPNHPTIAILGGGFKYVLFSSLFAEDSHFDEYFSKGLKPPNNRNRYGPVGFDLFHHLFASTPRCRSIAVPREKAKIQGYRGGMATRVCFFG